MSGRWSIAGAALALLAGLLPGPVRAQPALDSEHARTLYALGVVCGDHLIEFGLAPEELEIAELGLHDWSRSARWP